jgi:hypothetical protein
MVLSNIAVEEQNKEDPLSAIANDSDGRAISTGTSEEHSSHSTLQVSEDLAQATSEGSFAADPASAAATSEGSPAADPASAAATSEGSPATDSAHAPVAILSLVHLVTQ